MDTNNTTPQTKPDANLEGAAGGNGTVGGPNPQESSLSLSELNKALGKNFKDQKTALEALAETQRYAGQVNNLQGKIRELEGRIPSAAPEDLALVRTEISGLKNELWFEKNPQYKGSRSLIEKLAKADNKPLHEVIDLPEFKETFTKVQGFDESQRLKTVLESNPRLGSSMSKLEKAKEGANKRNDAVRQAAQDLAVQAVIEAYEV